MSASRPGRGPIATTGTLALKRARARRLHDGTWRPDRPFTHEDGLKITLRRAHGITDPGVLRVPLRLQAPVTGDFARDRGHPWSTYDTLRAGERSRPMGPKLLELPISSVLLDGPAQDSSSGLVVWPYAPEPLKVIDELNYIAGMGSGPATPFRLTINQPAVWGNDPVINMLATLTRVQATQKAGEVGTEYLDLTFLQFSEDELARHRQARADEKTRYHDLRSGESLYDLARLYYHQPSAWRRIAEANGIKGVSASSDAELHKWAARHHKRRLRIPPAPRSGGR